jgi:hypothetical protein
LEERLQSQARSVDLRQAVMACLSGRESRRWTISELVERFRSGRLRLTRRRDGGARKGGVTKTRVGTILGLEASTYLNDRAREGLIYCDPSRELNFWRPAPEALLALGLRSKSDIPALKELETWFDTQDEVQRTEKLDPVFKKLEKLAPAGSSAK